jgi:predicted metallopeptidase
VLAYHGFVMPRRKKPSRMDWKSAPDIKRRISFIVKNLDLKWIKPRRIYCFRSKYSTSRAYARIWGLSKVWQLALTQKPAYIIEVLSEKFDKLNTKEQDKVLIHELAHIPKNFSGSLLPHIRKRGKRNFEDRVRQMVKKYKNAENS